MDIFQPAKAKTKNPSPKRWLKPLLFVVLMVAGTLVHSVYQTTTDTLEGLWVKYQSPYPIKDEFFWDRRLTAHRSQISAITFGLLDNWVNKKHLEIAKSVKDKIPSDDIAWIEYWINSEVLLWPRPDKDNANQNIGKVVEALRLIKDGHSKVVSFEKYGKYSAWLGLAGYVRTNIYYSNLSMEEKQEILERIAKDSDALYKALTVSDNLSKNDEEAVIPLQLLLAQRSALDALINHYQLHGGSSCDSSELQLAKDLVVETIKVVPKYNEVLSKLPKNLSETTLRMTKDSDENIFKLKKSIEIYCNSYR